MPTREVLGPFKKDWKNLTAKQKQQFLTILKKFIHDLERGALRKGLRIKRIQGHKDIYELTWAPDGRATFEFGEEVRPGEPHIIWRRIGTHDIFKRP